MGPGCARSPIPAVAGIGDHTVADALLCLPRPTRAVAGGLESSGPPIGRDPGPDDGPSRLPRWHADRRQRLAASLGQSLPTGAAGCGGGPCPLPRHSPAKPPGGPRLVGAIPPPPPAATRPPPHGGGGA